MPTSIPLGWLQLKYQKLRLFAATLGITFAVILIAVQMEFREALFVSAVRYHSAMEYNLVMLSPKTSYLISSKQFPRNRLYQVLGFEEVETVSPVYLQQGSWRNPVDPTRSRNIFVVGFDPDDDGFGGLLDARQHQQIKIPDQLIFDRRSRPEYGPVVQMLDSSPFVDTEINDRQLSVVGMYSLGTSFGLDGGVISSDLNFLRMFPQRSKAAINLGLIKLKPGVDANRVREKILSQIPKDVSVLTPEEFKQLEVDHWNKTTPIGYIFTFGAIMGVVVGFIIVYQILFADVQDHLKEYATLKAMGYTHGYLRKVVLQQSIILALLGFLPGIGVSMLIFSKAAGVTGLPLEMDIEAALFIFGLTLFMCAGSGILALRKLRAVDPAEVF